MQHLTIKGLIVRETDFGDADRYITVLTEQGQRIEVLCKGVRRRNGRQAAAVRLFCWSELTLYHSRDRYTLTDAEIIRSFWGVTADMETYALGCYFAELSCAETGEENNPAVTRLFLYALRALTEQKRDKTLVKAAFELRLMAESGFLPDLSGCGVCGRPVQGTIYFSVKDGVVLDAGCLRRLGSKDAVPLPQGAYAAMAHIITSEMPRVFSFALGGQSLCQLAAVCEAYALYYAERDFHTLEFYHSLF